MLLGRYDQPQLRGQQALSSRVTRARRKRIMPRSQPRTCSRCRPGMAEWLEQLRCHLDIQI